MPSMTFVWNIILPLTSVTPQHVKLTDHTAKFDAADISENKVLAMIPYLMGLLGILIALLAGKDSAYTAFHVKQALKIQVCCALLAILAPISVITVIGPFVCGVCIVILWVVNIISFFDVCAGKAKEPAIVSGLKFLKSDQKPSFSSVPCLLVYGTFSCFDAK